MSITFGCPQAPVHNQVQACDFPGCVEGARCGYCKDGFDIARVSEAPECNFANSNARDILRILCEDTNDMCGSWDVEHLPTIKHLLMQTKNRESTRQHLVREPSMSQAVRAIAGEKGDVGKIEMGCKVIDCGNTDEQTIRRLEDLEELVTYAHYHKWEVTWG